MLKFIVYINRGIIIILCQMNILMCGRNSRELWIFGLDQSYASLCHLEVLDFKGYNTQDSPIVSKRSKIKYMPIVLSHPLEVQLLLRGGS